MTAKFMFAAVAVALLVSSHLAIAEDSAPAPAADAAPAVVEQAPAAAAGEATAPAPAGGQVEPQVQPQSQPLPAAATDAQAKGDADMKAAMQGEMERQLYASMVALKDYCKAASPADAAGFDKSWEANTADAPAELKALAATPEFAAKVAVRVKEMTDSTKVAAAAEELKGACAKILATK